MFILNLYVVGTKDDTPYISSTYGINFFKNKYGGFVSTDLLVSCRDLFTKNLVKNVEISI